MNQQISTLLKSDIPSIRYRTLTEILMLDSDNSEVKKERQEVINSKEADSIFSKMHPDGYWLQKNASTKEIVGKGVRYGSYATTHFALSYLSELGLTKAIPKVELAANRYLNLLNEEGDWWNHMSCLNGYNIRTFIRLGFRNDNRLQKAIDLILNTNRPDGGYLCDMHEKKQRRKPKKSCYRGALKVLLAFSELPEYWEHKRCKNLVKYFLDRNVIYNSKLTKYVTKEIAYNSYPITWGANTFEALLALSKMNYGNHANLSSAWELIEQHKTGQGKYILGQCPGQNLLKVGKKGEPNDWVTFYINLAKKHK